MPCVRKINVVIKRGPLDKEEINQKSSRINGPKPEETIAKESGACGISFPESRQKKSAEKKEKSYSKLAEIKRRGR